MQNEIGSAIFIVGFLVVLHYNDKESNCDLVGVTCKVTRFRTRTSLVTLYYYAFQRHKKNVWKIGKYVFETRNVE